MANEDSRQNSAVGGALKIAAAGALVYGGVKGGRALIRNYDDLGSTFLGGVGDKMTDGINAGLSKFAKQDGTNAVKEGLDKMQQSILDSDHATAIGKKSKLLKSLHGEGMDKETIDGIHDSFKGLSVADKRKEIANQKTLIKGMKEDLKLAKSASSNVAESAAESTSDATKL